MSMPAHAGCYKQKKSRRSWPLRGVRTGCAFWLALAQSSFYVRRGKPRPNVSVFSSYQPSGTQRHKPFATNDAA